MENRRRARSNETVIPERGDFGGPLCCVVAKYEDGTEITFGHHIMDQYQILNRLPAEPVRQMSVEELEDILAVGAEELWPNTPLTPEMRERCGKYARIVHPRIFRISHKVWGHPSETEKQRECQWFFHVDVQDVAKLHRFPMCPFCCVNLECEPRTSTRWVNVWKCGKWQGGFESAEAAKAAATKPEDYAVIAHPVTIELPEGK